MSYIRASVRLMIRKYGQTIMHKKKVIVNYPDGDSEFTYKIQPSKRGQVIELTPLDILVAKFGNRVEGDYLVTFLPNTDINEGDLLYLNGHWCEVMEHPLERSTAGKVDFLEAHCRRVG